MKQKTQILRSALALVLASSVILPSLARDKGTRANSSGRSAISIENFGQVNDHIYRGGQPEGGDYEQLAAMGIKTIVDLRGDADRSSRADAERAGLSYINLPLAPKHYPESDAAGRFLEIVNNQARWPVFVHCAGGRHRTGAMLAVYRMAVDNWTVDQAYNEMQQYDFYTSWGHACYKDYVFDYAKDSARLARLRQSSTASQQGAGTNQ